MLEKCLQWYIVLSYGTYVFYIVHVHDCITFKSIQQLRQVQGTMQVLSSSLDAWNDDRVTAAHQDTHTRLSYVRRRLATETSTHQTTGGFHERHVFFSPNKQGNKSIHTRQCKYEHTTRATLWMLQDNNVWALTGQRLVLISIRMSIFGMR